MQATITGSDDLSKRILIDLNSGIKVSQIPDLYPISLDQAKRLSRLNKMLNLATEHLDEDLYNRLKQLGLKVFLCLVYLGSMTGEESQKYYLL
jgi:hypothetical protein